MWFPLKAVAKQRARMSKPRRGRRSRAYTPIQTVHFENAVRNTYIDNGGENWGDAAVGVSIEIHKDGFDVKVFPLECSVRPVGIRGDIDNITKAIFDGLNGVAWSDDKQVEFMEVSFVGTPRKGTEYVDPSEQQDVSLPEVQPDGDGVYWKGDIRNVFPYSNEALGTQTINDGGDNRGHE